MLSLNRSGLRLRREALSPPGWTPVWAPAPRGRPVASSTQLPSGRGMGHTLRVRFGSLVAGDINLFV